MLGLYIATGSPTITWNHNGADSGELAAAALSLGIPHPPGYPTWVLLAHLAMKLLPGADPAARLVLLSALAAAASCVLVTLVAINLSPSFRTPSIPPHLSRPITGVAAGLFLGVSPLFWSQATIVEVYALNALLIAALLLLLVHWHRAEQKPRWLLPTVGLLIGIGAGVHATILLMIPAIAILTWKRVSVTTAMASFAALALGLSVFLLLPLYARGDPPVSWGEASTLDGFIWLVTGTPYQGLLFSLGIDEMVPRAVDMVALLARQLGGGGWLLAAWGATGLWRKDRRLLIAFSAIFATFSGYAFVYGTGDSLVYFIPALIVAAITVGYGLARIVDESYEVVRGYWPMPVAIALALGPLLTVAVAWQRIDLSGDDEALAYARNVVNAVTQQDIVLPDGDRHIFSLWYYCYGLETEGCPTIVTPALLQFEWYREQVVERTGLFPTQEGYDEALAAILRQEPPRRVFISTDTYTLPEGFTRVEAAAGLYQVVPEEAR